MNRILFAIALLLASPAVADTVTLTGSDDGAGRIMVDGQVVDYTGSKLTIKSVAGSERSFPASRVVKIDTKWPDGWHDALTAIDAQKYREAVDLLAKAARTDNRPWVRRLAMQHLMHCYAATGDYMTAGRLLVELARSDIATPALAEAPLAWYADDSIPAAATNEWLDNTEVPIAQLLGASYALATAERGRAEQAIDKLLKSPDPSIAWLAEMQSWRPQIVTAKADDVARWETRVRQAPESLQAGGWLVLGDARRQLKQYDPAALAYLRASMLAKPQPQLAAHSLWRASEVLRLAGQVEEATKLARQVVDEYPQTAPAREAQGVLH
ncbi:tol-pal system YbgF family protein [Aeoliella mucimassa]|uniref:Tetratricopeptide repeat protein n=1 Tax=Aeoliella mucimassa TaxID=2527972 RepID=A0A518AIH9_9BACT|nr:hypothetical protein [Aeoliella mucimassa]QDU54541.1 hypothetical protein Pan181_07240 [Aeoliella mucimassa]